MKFSLVALAATGVAAAVVERDGKLVNGVIADVQSGIEKLDSTVKSYSGDKGPLVSASEALVSSIKSGKTKVDGSGDLSQDDALALITPVQDLTKASETLVNDLKSKRDQVEKAGECDTVRGQLQQISSNSDALVKSIVSKVPEALQGTAASLSAGVKKQLDAANEDFSEANCKNASGGGSTSTQGGGGSTSSAPGTETSAPATETSAPATETSAPATESGSATGTPTGGETPTATNTPPVITAGAAAFAPAAALAAVAAAFAL